MLSLVAVACYFVKTSFTVQKLCFKFQKLKFVGDGSEYPSHRHDPTLPQQLQSYSLSLSEPSPETSIISSSCSSSESSSPWFFGVTFIRDSAGLVGISLASLWKSASILGPPTPTPVCLEFTVLGHNHRQQRYGLLCFKRMILESILLCWERR